MTDSLAVYLPGADVSVPTNPYGRLVANAGTYRALAQFGGFAAMHFQCRNPPPARQLAEALGIVGGTTDVRTGSILSTSAAVAAGTLLSGQAYLSQPAWLRRQRRHDRDYAIVGTIFALASPEHREQMLYSLLAPLHPWDAMICSSPTLAQTVSATLDRWQEHLREQLLTPDLVLPRPALPVIPFGCEVDRVGAQAADGQARAHLRESLGVAADDVVVFYLGRLSYFDKAAPQAMFRAVQAAQERTGVRTHLVLAGWFPQGDVDRARYEQAAASYAADVPVWFLDGNDPATVARCWAGADIFFQLSDTILETFGQALVEAMAAGLPLVVSDWDGFRFIVRDGVDGLLVPTLGGPPGAMGQTLAHMDATGVLSYPDYSGSVAAHTAVNGPRAAAALAELIADPQLRRRMGDCGRQRARQVFAWPLVVGAYQELFSELRARRLAAPPTNELSGQTMNPLRSDPFADFHALPTQVLTDATVLHLAGPAPAGIELDLMFAGMRSREAETQLLLELLATGPATVGDLVAAFPATRRPFVRMTLMWLAKAGTVDWLPG